MAAANTQGSSGPGRNPSLSMDSRTECLYEITDDYLNSLTPGQVPSPRKIQNDLLARISAEFDAINTAKGKGSRWKKPDGLEPFMIAEILAAIYPIKAIASAGLSSEPEYDLLGIYQTSGKDKGIYKTDDQTFRQLIRKFNRALQVKQIAEVTAVLRDSVERVEPNHDKHLVAVNNGIFDYDAKKLLPFSEDLIFTTKCYIDYDPNAVNPVITQADGTKWDVVSWMNTLSDNPEVVKLLWEIIGAAIRPNVPWNVSAWFYSESGNNGKGTLCELIRQLVGESNCASISLNDFSKDFQLEPLTHSCAIVVDENDVGTYIDKAANLKAVVTGDTISINRKFKQPIAYKFHGFMIQCLNEMPRIKDKSDSFFRRQLFVPFTKCFTGHENKAIKKDYLHRIEVLKFVLKTVLEMDYYQLDTPDECMLAQKEYKIYNDPVRQFAEEMFPQFKWDLVPFSFMHDLYVAWYKRNFSGDKPESAASLAKDVINILGDYPEWTCRGRDVKVRSTYMMTQAEPLIDEYELKNWLNPRYKTASDRTKACTPVPAASYRGIIRVSAQGNAQPNP